MSHESFPFKFNGGQTQSLTTCSTGSQAQQIICHRRDTAPRFMPSPPINRNSQSLRFTWWPSQWGPLSLSDRAG